MSYLINNRGLKVHEHGPGHVLAGPGLREEGVERVISDAYRVIPGNGAVRVDPVLQAVQLPVCKREIKFDKGGLFSGDIGIAVFLESQYVK